MRKKWVGVFILILCIGAQTLVVTFTFDGSFIEHVSLSKIMSEVGYVGTFYVNGLRLEGTDSRYMNIKDVHQIAEHGHEIGSNSKDGMDLSLLNVREAHSQMCGDRGILYYYGWNVTSFSYPFGKSTIVLEKIAEECGYNSAKILSNRSEKIPPINYYFISSFSDLSISIFQNVTQQSNSDWFIFQVKDIVSSDFEIFINQFKAIISTTTQIVVKSIGEVIGGDFKKIPSEYEYNGPPTFFELGLIIGLSLMGGLIIFIVIYMTITACKRYQKQKRKEQAIIEMEQKNVDGF